MVKRWLCSTLGVAILLMVAVGAARSEGTTLPPHIIVGYWHNFENAAGTLRLADVPLAYDVVDVAFPDILSDGTIVFTPLPALYSARSQFTIDINLLRSRGQKVLISLGGANATLRLNSDTEVQKFVGSLSSIIREFGFDGIDLDLEGASLALETGDTDFQSPTTPAILNLIKAVTEVLAQFPGGLILSAAPETAYVQGGYGTYAGIFGAYLPVLHALRDKLTYVHVQDYNTGAMYGRDGSVYSPGTPDFLVSMTDMLIAGFRVDAFRESRNTFFPGFGADKVLIGIPAAPDAAGSGFMPFVTVKNALDYLYAGESFGGKYQLASPTGYPQFRGVMTWSINWDVYAGLSWSSAYRSYLDALVTGVEGAAIHDQTIPNVSALGQNYPNPFNPATSIRYVLPHQSQVRLAVFNLLGEKVVELVDGVVEAGNHEVKFSGAGLASGMYICRMTAGAFTQSRKMILAR